MPSAREPAVARSIIDGHQKDLDREAAVAARRSELGPASGLDTAGAPPLAELARAEADARRRLSPRRRLWGELAAFDERVAELDARHAAARANLHAVADLLKAAPSEDAASLSRWIADGEQGPRPTPSEPQLREQLSNAELEVAALRGAVSSELQRKDRFVQRNRDRLAGEAGRLADRARNAYAALIDQLAEARAELVEIRAAELWALAYPSESASRMPQFDHIGCALKAAYPEGQPPLTVAAALQLLHADSDALVSAMDPRMRAEVSGVDPRAVNAQWGEVDATPSERQRAMAALVEGARREFGREPTELEVEAFARERAKGGV